jgi:phage gp29-like protein
MTLTNSDVKQIRNVVKEELDEQLDDKLNKLKSDFYERIDPILKEVTTAQEERPLIENRIEKLEEIHPQGQHSFTV